MAENIPIGQAGQPGQNGQAGPEGRPYEAFPERVYNTALRNMQEKK